MGTLDGRTAIVTGAGRGIGRAEALLLAAEGTKVLVNDVDGDHAKAVVDEIAAAGGEALANSDDVSSWAGAEAIVDRVVAEWGRLDILVNNAGVIRDAMSFSLSEEQWDDVVRVHLKGHIACARFAGAHWRERSKSGRARRQRPHRQHRERVRPLRTRRTDQLRDGQGRHRVDDHRVGTRAAEVRRHGERDRATCRARA